MPTSEISLWGLSLAYAIHLVATVVWIGSLTALTWVILPAAMRNLDEMTLARLLLSIQQRLDPLAWFCLLLLLATGMFQMSANPNYQGLLAIQNTWAQAILVKHILFIGMILVNALLTWGILPALRRNLLLLAAGKEAKNVHASLPVLQRRNLLLLHSFRFRKLVHKSLHQQNSCCMFLLNLQIRLHSMLMYFCICYEHNDYWCIGLHLCSSDHHLILKLLNLNNCNQHSSLH